MSAPPPPVRDEPRCLTCGYSLAGLAAGAVCPECARPVALSTDRPLACLSDSEAARLAGGLGNVKRSFLWVLSGVGVMVVTVPLELIIVALVGVVCVLVGCALWIIGWLRIARVQTLLEPPPAPRVRVTLQVLACSQAVASLSLAGGAIGLPAVFAAWTLPLAVLGTALAGAAWLEALARGARLESLLDASALSFNVLVPGVACAGLTLAAVVVGERSLAHILLMFAVIAGVAGVITLWFLVAQFYAVTTARVKGRAGLA